MFPSVNPTPVLGARELYRGDAVILGETRFERHDATFRGDSVAEVWPNIAFPRAPVGIHHSDAAPLLGDANTAILFTVGRPYRRISVGGRGSWTEWIEVRPDVLAEMVRQHDRSSDATDAAPFRYGGSPTPSVAYLAHRRMRRMLEGKDPLDPLELEETALTIAAQVLAAAFALLGTRDLTSPTDSDRRQRRIVFDVQALLHRRLMEPLRLAEVSAAVEVSPHHLCRVFRRQTGVPIHRYRDWLRLRSSLERIADGSARVLDIALDLGYANEAHFSDAFQRAFGLRPSVFRKSASSAILRGLRDSVPET